MLPLYQDEGVIVTRDYILIKKYYFPLATSRTILYSQLEYIALHDATDVKHRWGACTKYLNNWFPYDSQRKKKTKFIEFVVKGKRMRPSITPDDPEALFAILNQWLTPKIPQGQAPSENVNNEMESQGKNEFGEPQTIPTVSID